MTEFHSPDSKKARIAALTIKHLWMGLPVYILVLKGFIFPLPLLDFWWHLKMGQIIVTTGSIPRTDLFSFTATGKLFIVQNWLSEIILYLTYRLGGFPLLIFLNSLLLVAVLIPVYSLCRKATPRFWPPILGAILVAIFLPGNVRPQVYSFIFFSIFYLLLENYKSQRRDQLWLMPILMVFWVNLHGGFVLGLVLGIIYLATCISPEFLKGFDRISFTNRQAGKLGAMLLLSILATLINPEGFGIYEYIATVLRDPSSQRFVVEWQPPVINTIPGALLFFLPFLIVTLALILTNRKINVTDLALYLAFSVLGFSGSRYSAFFLIIIAPLVSRYTSAEQVGDRDPHSAKEDLAASSSGTARSHPFFNVVIMVAALAVMGMNSPWIRQGIYNRSLFEPKTPVGAMNYIEEHSLRGNILHPQIYGDYLIWRLWPRQKSFFDGRVHLFGEPFLRYYQRVFGDSRWQELLSNYDIRYLLLSKEDDSDKLNNMIDTARSSGSWHILYEDNHSILFESRGKR